MVGTFCKRTRYLLLICQKLECDVVRCLCLRFSLYTHDQNKRHLMGFSELLIAIWYKNQDMSQFMRRNHLIYSLSKILGVTTAAFDFCAGSKPKNHARHAFETTSQSYFLRMLALPFVIMLLAMKLNQKQSLSQSMSGDFPSSDPTCSPKCLFLFGVASKHSNQESIQLQDFYVSNH